MDRLGKILLIGVLSCFYLSVIFLIFHPSVCEEYEEFYIERTLNRYPGKERLPRKGRFTWEEGYKGWEKRCFSEKNLMSLPERWRQYLKNVARR